VNAKIRGGRKMATEISKRDAAALSAAIAVYLAKSRPAKSVSVAEVPTDLEPLLEKIIELERKMDRLSLSVEELREKVERIEKR
jgi:hypothetical protein